MSPSDYELKMCNVYIGTVLDTGLSFGLYINKLQK